MEFPNIENLKTKVRKYETAVEKIRTELRANIFTKELVESFEIKGECTNGLKISSKKTCFEARISYFHYFKIHGGNFDDDGIVEDTPYYLIIENRNLKYKTLEDLLNGLRSFEIVTSEARLPSNEHGRYLIEVLYVKIPENVIERIGQRIVDLEKYELTR